MIQKYFYFILIFAVFGCSEFSGRSGMTMSEDKLATLLSDLHVAEAYVESEVESVRDSLAKMYTAQIFKKHGVTEAEFDTTMGWLARRPKLLELVYKKVTYRVEKRDSFLHERDSLLQVPKKN